MIQSHLLDLGRYTTNTAAYRNFLDYLQPLPELIDSLHSVFVHRLPMLAVQVFARDVAAARGDRHPIGTKY